MTESFNPMSTPQRKKLACLLRERGLWDDRHAVCDCLSLTELSRDEAARHIDRLAGDKPEPRGRKRGRRPLLAGEVRLATDATTRQRETIIALLRRLGWYTGPDALKNGIRGRHKIANIGSSHIDRGLASELINELGRAVRRAPDPQSPIPNPQSVESP